MVKEKEKCYEWKREEEEREELEKRQKREKEGVSEEIKIKNYSNR